MSPAAVRALRSRWMGWMGPSVGKVGAAVVWAILRLSNGAGSRGPASEGPCDATPAVSRGHAWCGQLAASGSPAVWEERFPKQRCEMFHTTRRSPRARPGLRTDRMFPRASSRRAPGGRVTGVWAMWLLVTLCILPIVLPSTGTAIAMSGSPPPDPIKLGVPELSPDGKLVALGVTLDEFLPRLAVFDIDREELVVVDRPDNEGWLAPSFSPSGDRIAFIRYCVEKCAVGTQGFQIAILDRENGATTTVTSGRDLYRGSPLFSPDGQSIVFGSKNLAWKDDPRRSGYQWRHRLPHATAGGGTLRIVDLRTGIEREILSGRFGVTQFATVSPSGFLDENTLIFKARQPAGSRIGDSSPLYRELERLVGAKDAAFRFYGYRLTLGEKLEFMSPDAPKRIGRVPGLSVSSDTGRLVFTGRSGRDPENPKFLGYDVFLGDGEMFRPVTSLLTHMAHTAISKSGNRVSFLVDHTRNRNWSLWVLDVETGQVRETSLRRRLHEWHRASGSD